MVRVDRLVSETTNKKKTLQHMKVKLKKILLGGPSERSICSVFKLLYLDRKKPWNIIYANKTFTIAVVTPSICGAIYTEN